MVKQMILGLIVAGILFCVTAGLGIRRFSYSYSSHAVGNPLMGLAPPAESDRAEGYDLVYIDITWRELEPEKGTFQWEQIDKTNRVQEWKKKGKHAVLRFVCDIPGEKGHMDIPDWLYRETGQEGDWYDMEYGAGYAPDYSNPIFMKEHERVLKEIGAHVSKDGFVRFVELGSLGHWGEWHVNYARGIRMLPGISIRSEYVRHYNVFTNAKLLMRRPFQEGKALQAGVYNDMAGDEASTREWLTWLNKGGLYDQTKEKSMVPYPDWWKKAPVGGEFTSGIPMKKMFGEDFNQTIELIRDSHTTFLGPKIPKKDRGEMTEEQEEDLLRNMGYRIWISDMLLERNGIDSWKVRLTWKNSGVAPFYWDWPVFLYQMEGKDIVEKIPVSIRLSELKDGTQSQTVIRHKKGKLGIGIEDPDSGKPAILFCMKTETVGRIMMLE